MKRTGFTLIELMMVVTIVAILAVIAYRSSRDTYYKSNLTSQMVTLKGVVLKSRVRAVEKTGVSRVTIDNTGRVLALIDLDRGGVYGQDGDGAEDIGELIAGDSLTLGVSLNVTGAEMIRVDDSRLGTDVIPHPSGAYDIDPGSATGWSTFPNDQFFIGPTGIVRDSETSRNPVRGTMFMATTDD